MPSETNAHRRRSMHERLDKGHAIDADPLYARFLARFVDCEVSAKTLITFYRRDQGKPRRRAHSPLNVRAVTAAARHFKLDIDADAIRSLFLSGKGRRGAMTPRQLRNHYLHEKLPADAEEIRTREQTLFSTMDRWLRAIRRWADAL